MMLLSRTTSPLADGISRALSCRPWLTFLTICLSSIKAYPAGPGADLGPASTASFPIRLQRTLIDPNAYLSRGYDNLQAGRLEAARRDYEQARSADAKNIDALLGLATIARRQNRIADAESHYRQVLEADPTNAIALAAILSTAASTSTGLAESQLKNLLSGQPQSGPLNFALGNLYSRQKRWRDAQQSYFNALTVDDDNPDYLFNLAVSLDHLRQSGPAARHYRQALDAADRRPPAFDREGAKKRLQLLEP